jgi:hypothetical protein
MVEAGLELSCVVTVIHIAQLRLKALSSLLEEVMPLCSVLKHEREKTNKYQCQQPMPHGPPYLEVRVLFRCAAVGQHSQRPWTTKRASAGGKKLAP